MKKLIFLVVSVVVLVLAAGGFFYWWSQADVRELNKGFVNGDKIVKDWRGNYSFMREIDGKSIQVIKIIKQNGQYKVINNRYDYEFLLPEDRIGFWRLEYLEKSDEGMEYFCRTCSMANVLFVGLVGGKGDNMTLESYRPKDQNIGLDDFVENGNPTWLYKMDVEKTKIGDVDIIIASREYGPENNRGRFYYYFFKGLSNFYKIEHVSKEFIDFLVSNGKW